MENYYLHRKANYRHEYPLVASLGMSWEWDLPCHLVEELTNGFVWQGTFYPTVEELNKVFYQVIHIGTSRVGWRFLLCQYPKFDISYESEFRKEYYLEKEIMSLDDWIEIFNDPKNVILTGYGKELTPEEMVSIIKNGTDTLGCKETDLKEYRGTIINGLSCYDKEHLMFGKKELFTISSKEKNYDLVLSGNNPKRCHIFGF